MDADMLQGIQSMQVGTQPSARAFNGDVLERDTLGSNLGNGSACQVDIDRSDDISTAKCRGGTTAAQKRLVHVVVQNVVKPVSVFTTERAREFLGQGIADRIGMADAFAFDKLHGVIGSLKCGYDNVAQRSQPSLANRAILLVTGNACRLSRLLECNLTIDVY